MKFSTKTSSALATLPLASFAAAAKSCKPPVESEAYQKLITQDALMGNLQTLNDIAYANGGNRAFGFPGYTASVDFITGELEKLKGFEYWTQDFPALFTETTSLEFTAGGEDYRVFALTYSPSTPEEGATAEIVRGPEGEAGCFAENYDGLGVEGKIVLVERWRCPDATTFAGRVKPAAAAGAVAVVIYNNGPVEVSAGTLSNPSPEYVPAALINQAPGQALAARLAGGEAVTAHLQLTQIIEERITQNVFAETRGGDPANVVMLGAHLDSVQAGPGVNDDGSGTSLILELTKALSHFSTKLKVRFAWWGAEENGKLGSVFYCENLPPVEVDNLLAYLNFDMVSKGYYGVFDGDGSSHGLAGPDGSDVIERLFVDDMAGTKGLNVTPAVFTMGSDYASFFEILNKPVGGLHTGTGVEQDPCYHQACDNITNPNPEQIYTNAKAVAHVLSLLAMEGDELIPKAPANATMSVRGPRNPVAVDVDRFEAMGERHMDCGHDV